MIAALIIKIGLLIVFGGLALEVFVIGAVVDHSWSINDYLRNKAHQRNRKSASII